MGKSRAGWLMISLMLSLSQAICAAPAAAATPSSVRIPLAQETLANGLRVIYVPVHRAPVVDVRVIYRVGSRDERAGQHGWAHLLEHMMFRGSAHVGAADYPRLIRSVGGDYDGQTTRDATTYFQIVPRNQLALALWLEADRMASFHVSEPVYRIERNIVLQELAMRQDIPYSVPTDDLIHQLFSASPYGWSTGGNPADLMAASPENIEKFFERFHGPNNAILIITGDFDPAAARKLVHGDFAWIARGANVSHSAIAGPEQTPARHVEITWPVAHPVLMVGCRGPSYGSPDRAAIEVLAAVIDTRLRNLLDVSEHPLCSSTFAKALPMEDAGCICIGATMLPGESVKAVERIISVQLDILRTEGLYISRADFAAARDAACNELLRRRQTVQGLAETIGEGAALTGDATAADRFIKWMRELTPADVQSAMKKYVRPEAMTFLVINPQTAAATSPPEAGMARNCGNRWKALTPALSRNTGRGGKKAVFPAGYPTTAPVDDEIVRPRAAPLHEFQMRGLRVILAPDASGEISLRLILPRGAEDDPPGKEGLGWLTAKLVAQMARKPDHDPDVGIPYHAPYHYSVHQEPNFSEIDVRAPMAMAGHLMHEIHRALAEKLELGLFDSRLVTLKWKLFNQNIADNERAELVADKELSAALFAGTPLGRGPTAPSLRAISRGDLTAWRSRLFSLRGAVLVMSGNPNPNQAKALVSKLMDDLGSPTEPAALSPSPDNPGEGGGEGTRGSHVQPSPNPLPEYRARALSHSAMRQRPHIILVDSPDAVESVIRIGVRTPAWDADKLAAADTGRWILSQRIWRQVRAESGYAYDVVVHLDQFHNTGALQIGTEIACARTGEALSMLLANLRQITDQPVSSQELRDAARAYAGALAIELQTTGEQADWRAMALIKNQSPDTADRIKRMQAMTAEQIRRIFKICMGTSRMVIVIVGPAARVRSQLQSMGEVEILAMPNHRPGAATRPAYEELPRSM